MGLLLHIDFCFNFPQGCLQKQINIFLDPKRKKEITYLTGTKNEKGTQMVVSNVSDTGGEVIEVCRGLLLGLDNRRRRMELLPAGATPIPKKQRFRSLKLVNVDMEQLLPHQPVGVDYGTLDNGLRYYVRCNSKPRMRAALALAVRAG